MPKEIKTAFATYKVGKQLGSGGAGTVFEVTDQENREFAAKILNKSQATRERLKRFKNEAQFCYRCEHKNVIKVVDFGITTEGSSFYVMPLYVGTLRSLLSSGIPKQNILSMFGQILDGVEAAHLLAVSHRDLKPENILYDGPSNTLVVADFGIAHFEEDDLFTAVETKAQDRLANFQYSAPEQRVRGKQVNSTADIYALGLILNEMFTGEIPQGVGFRRIGESSEDYAYLDSLVDQMIHQDATKRPLRLEDVKKELIGRENEFISLQRPDVLKHTVVPESEIEDPLVRNPIQIASIDYRNGTLFIRLDGEPNAQWKMFVKDPGSFSFSTMIHPSMFEIQGKLASVQVDAHWAQSALDYFKGYVAAANQLYKEFAEQRHRKRIEDERRTLEARIREEEIRLALLEKLKL